MEVVTQTRRQQTWIQTVMQYIVLMSYHRTTRAEIVAIESINGSLGGVKSVVIAALSLQHTSTYIVLRVAGTLTGPYAGLSSTFFFLFVKIS